jgi:dTDP-4-amino-4,6-dideoxygalactose transaminase
MPETKVQLPMSSPDLSDEDVAAVLEVLRSPTLSAGPYLARFEAAVAELAGTRHAVAVSSGTAGLHLAVIAAGVGPGDLVLTTPFSFVASANVILYERGVPVFIDVDPATGNIDPAALEETVRALRSGGETARRVLPPALRDAPLGEVKAMIPVDVFGQPADMAPIEEQARLLGVPVLEDSCEAIGAEYRGQPAGSFGDCGVFAFYPNKQMTTGEGGAIVTDRDDWAALFRSLRNQGRDDSGDWLRHVRLGYNYRLPEMSAALGCSQLARLDSLLQRRAQVADWYAEELAELPGVGLPNLSSTTTRMSWFVYVVQFERGRDRIREALASQGIPTRTYFSPIHLQPFYVTRFGYSVGDFPVTERLGRTSLALPFSSVMSRPQVREVGDAVRSAFRSI